MPLEDWQILAIAEHNVQLQMIVLRNRCQRATETLTLDLLLADITADEAREAFHEIIEGVKKRNAT